jgi:V/A-type H+-transporting ATPase subunit B
VLASVVGSEGLTEIDRLYLRLGDGFEGEFANQGGQRRTLEQSMEIGWRLLALLPRSELHRVSDAQIQTHIEPLRTSHAA